MTKLGTKRFIGIDPDVNKSGVATRSGSVIALYNMTFFELYDYLVKMKGPDLMVVVEAGWMNKSNWHKVQGGTASVNAKIGQRTGANHEVGRKIVEMLEHLKIEYRLSRPTNTKVKANFFKAITGITERTNQEQRDAYMLIHGL